MILKYGTIILALTAFFAVLPLGNKGCAQTAGSGGGGIAPQTCDTQVWQTMEMRARMETEREIMQNQNLIFKPDSILAYTCFDKFAEHTAQYVGPLFTHTTYWGGKEIVPWGSPDGMDHAIQGAVLKSMDTYLQSNFPYSMLGGRGDELGGNGLSTYTTSMTGKGSYSCDRMNNVWKTAKCINFIHNDGFSDTDGYYPFIDMKGHDGGEDVKGYQTINETRVFPSALACTGSTPVYQNTWYVAWLKSRNENLFGYMNRFYKFSQPLVTTFQDVRKKVDPGKCDNAIYTGVTVIESAASGGKTYPDGVCTNPGCVYVKTGSTGSCQSGGTAPGGR